MEGNRFALAGGKHVTKAIPDVPPLTHFCGCQVLLAQLQIQRFQPWAVVPEHTHMLGQFGEIRQGVPIFLLVGAIKADDDLLEVRHFGEFFHNVLKGRAFKL